MKKDFDQGWNVAMTEMASGMKEWRLAHPRATMLEIEEETARRLAKLQAQMMQDMALGSAAADVVAAKADGVEMPRCAQCGGVMQARGKRRRRLTGAHNEQVELERSYLECPACGAGIFPPG